MKETANKVLKSLYTRFCSKKFFLVLLSAYLLHSAKIDAGVFQTIMMVYLGAEGTRDVASIIKPKKEEPS